jgi:hypothetical protein
LDLPASKDFYLDEIRASVNTVQFVTDFGAKFVTSDTVCLGGFDKAKEELILIKNLIIAAHGTSLIAAEYGAFILKYLEVFNSVQVVTAHELTAASLARVK